ncbi:MAG: hypothetical protein U0269_33120 [Polyangiales bacterium]
MRERLDEVLARIDKELDRSDSPHTTAGTAYVGGIAKLGANLDAYLLEVWRWVNVRLQRDPDEIARSSNPPILLDRATAGQLLFLLSKLATSAVADEPEVRWVIAEARDGSALDRALSLRNAIVHGRTTPDAKSIRAALSQLRNALAPQRALLGGGR